MHDVKIDDDGIASAFDSVSMGGTATPGALPGPSPEVLPPVAEAWAPVTRLAASLLANKVCPAWQVPADVQGQWADALGECLEQLMPGGLGNIDAWGPWGKLAFASGVWLMAGFDPDTMTLKPRYPEEDADGNPVNPVPMKSGDYKTDA